MKNSQRRPQENKQSNTKNTKESKKAKEERLEADAAKASASAQKKKELRSSKPSEVIYRIKTKRDSSVLMAFITFNYRVFHPNTATRMIFYGILIFLPGFLVDIPWVRYTLFTLGILVVLLSFFRKYISLALTKSNDIDYKNGTEYTYDFTNNDASFYRNDQLSSYMKYRDITGFYYDDDFYYLVFKNHEFHILPKSKFTMGSAKDFEDFIYKKCRVTCKWIPTKFKDKMAKRRAARNLQNRQ